MEEKNPKNKYITLAQAARLCSYSEPYLRLRARQGKLKSIKLGQKWMTTCSWLDDYEARVREWRQAAEMKKTALAKAAFVAAPPEISQVLDSQSKTDSVTGGSDDVSLAKEGPGYAAVFCARKAPLPPPAPRRVLAAYHTGQIFPPPKQDLRGEFPDYGWFGAFLSGAFCALILFFAMIPGGLSEAGLFNAGMASINNFFNFSNRQDLPAANLKVPEEYPQVTEQSGATDLSPLKALVEEIADYLGGNR